MKNTYLVSYDLMSPGRDYQEVYDYFKEFDDKTKPLYSVYFIHTDHTAKQIRDELKALVDENDKILVIKVSTSHWTSSNIGSAAEWLKNH